MGGLKLIIKILEFADGGHHEDVISPLLARSGNARRVYLWAIDNLYAREVLGYVRQRQAANKVLKEA